jgi:hypothetical protein
MSETAHTPAPWTIEEYGDEDAPTLVIHKDSETRVCFMATPGSHGDPAKIEADARLIAAAPEMYEALKSLVNEDTRIDLEQSDADVGKDAMAVLAKMRGIARRAIAKAEGRNPPDSLRVDGSGK